MESDADPRNSIDCYYFLTTGCKKGAECPFRHKESIKTTNKICKYFQNGSCQKGSNCEFRHPDLDMDYQKSDLVCWYFNNGGCRSGDSCFNKHIENTPKDDPASKDNSKEDNSSKKTVFNRLSSKPKAKQEDPKPVTTTTVKERKNNKEQSNPKLPTKKKPSKKAESKSSMPVVKKDGPALSVIDRLQSIPKKDKNEGKTVKRKREDEIVESSNKNQKVSDVSTKLFATNTEITTDNILKEEQHDNTNIMKSSEAEEEGKPEHQDGEQLQPQDEGLMQYQDNEHQQHIDEQQEHQFDEQQQYDEQLYQDNEQLPHQYEELQFQDEEFLEDGQPEFQEDFMNVNDEGTTLQDEEFLDVQNEEQEDIVMEENSVYSNENHLNIQMEESNDEKVLTPTENHYINHDLDENIINVEDEGENTLTNEDMSNDVFEDVNEESTPPIDLQETHSQDFVTENNDTSNQSSEEGENAIKNESVDLTLNNEDNHIVDNSSHNDNLVGMEDSQEIPALFEQESEIIEEIENQTNESELDNTSVNDMNIETNELINEENKQLFEENENHSDLESKEHVNVEEENVSDTLTSSNAPSPTKDVHVDLDIIKTTPENKKNLEPEYPCIPIFNEIGLTIDILNAFPDDMKNTLLNSVSKEEILELISNSV